MRKLFLLSLLLSVMAAYARQISPEEAAAVASEFINFQRLTTRNSETPLKVTNASEETGEQAYYVFNAAEGEGFVIVSGDDRYNKILGYSDKGTFDFKKMPPQLKGLLERFAENSREQTNWNGVHPSWNAMTSSTRGDEGVLLPTANWGQWAPYNEFCQTIYGEEAPTGCVATAMAILMKYHSWPAKYNWDAMPMEIPNSGEPTASPNQDLARLMKDAGEAVKMSYGTDVSGANMNWVGHKLQSVFHYSPDCQFITAANFAEDEWQKMLKENLDNGNPVIYQGSNEDYTNNHAFVLDGYNDTGYHINWGWDGWYNGYYALEALTPTKYENYSCNTGMVMNIIPDKSGKKYSECFTDYGYFWSDAGLGASMNLSVENVVKGEPFHVINSSITVAADFDGVLGVGLVDKDDNIKEVLKTKYFSSPNEPSGIDTSFDNLCVTVDVDPTDRIQLITKDSKDDDFRLVLGTLEWPSYVGVSNNTPIYSTIKFNIGPNVKCSYSSIRWGQGDGELTEGEYEFRMLKGSDIYCIFTPEIPDAVVTVSLKGNVVYGNEERQTGKEIHFHPGVDDYVFTANIVEYIDKEIELTEAGTLNQFITEEEGTSIRDLKISGKMNALDFWYLRDHCPSMKSLDLKEVNIEAVTALDEKFDVVAMNEPENTMPSSALTGLDNLESIELPENLVGIGNDALMAMNLLSISIPEGVTSIGINVLFYNPRLQYVEMRNPEPVAIFDCVFAQTLCPERGTLYVPEGAAESYKEALVWKDFQTIIEGSMPSQKKFETTVDGIKYQCFMNQAGVSGYEENPSKLVIPEKITVEGVDYTVTNILPESFRGCNTLESVEMGDGITDIGYDAFMECQSLKSVKLSKNLKYIARGAFQICRQLEECDLPSGLEKIGPFAFYAIGLKKVVIPKTAESEDWQISFSDLSNLEKFEVEEGSENFTAKDGVLYRYTPEGLSLECVPGLYQGTLTLPEDCQTIKRYSMIDINGVTEIIFNENLSLIEGFTLQRSTGLRHIVLPKNAYFGEYAIWAENLESVTFTGNLSQRDNMFTGCYKIKNLIIESPDEVVDLTHLFADPIEETVNIYTSSLEKNFIYGDKYKLYVAGGTSDSFNNEGNEVQEMWKYEIDRESKIITITPQIDGITIDKVTINGEEAKNLGKGTRGEASSAFVCAVEDADNMEVNIDFTLLGYQKMACRYTSEFNSNVGSTPSGVGEILIDGNSETEVYSIDGVKISESCSRETLNSLPSGIYILRKGNETKKIMIK